MGWAWTAALTIIGLILGSAVISTALSGWQTTRLRKQELFAKAYQVALRRVEMLYRILRRTVEIDEDAKLRDAMHEIQEDTSYYIGLLSMESKELGEAYLVLINKIKMETADSFRLAWKSKPGNPGVELKGFNHPKFETEELAFLEAVRKHFRLFNTLRSKFSSDDNNRNERPA